MVVASNWFDAVADHERLLTDFETAWSSGQKPAIETFAPAGPSRPTVLAALVRIDLEFRAAAGEPITLEEYCRRFPELAQDTDAVSSLKEWHQVVRGRYPEVGSSSETTPQLRGKPGAWPAIPGYEITAELGRGGMGVVYQATDLTLQRTVAIKMILGGALAGDEIRNRFLTEARSVARLHHPNIVQVHEVGEYNGLPYCALEYLSGGALDDRLAGQPQTPAHAAATVRTLAGAVEAAHQAGIIHRDLKPANVLLAADGTLKITDFGLAKRLDADATRQTKSGDVVGTPAYMAPEQASGRNRLIGPATDIYALGAILYELLTGRPPFVGVAPTETILLALTTDPMPPTRLVAGLPRDLETICLECLQKEPARRYANAAALADDLGRFLDGKPIHARPVSRLEKTWRWCKRNPAVAALTATVMLLVIGAIAGLAGGLATVTELNHELKTANADLLAANEREREQRQQAHDAAADAAAQAKQAKAVSDFLLAAFKKPHPEADGKNLLVVDLLKDAATQLEREYSGDPALKASLLEVLGMTLHGLGESAQATELLRRSLTTRQEVFGPDHVLTLTAKSNLALALRASGQLSEALPLLEQVLPLQKERLGPDHQSTLYTANGLAIAYRDAGRTAEAAALWEEVVTRMEAVNGPDHPDTLQCMNNLAGAYENLGRLKNAQSMLEQLVERSRSALGPDHPRTLNTMHNLAVTYHTARLWDKALPLWRQILLVRQEKLGPDHPDTLTTMLNLATTCRELGQIDESRRLNEETLAKCQAKLGLDHPLTLTAMTNMATLYWSSRQLDKSIPLFEQGLRLYEAKRGRDHPDTLLCMSNLAVNYRDAGRLADAIPLFEEVVRRAKARPGPPLPRLPSFVENLVDAYLLDRNFAKAESVLEEFLADQRRQFPAGSLQLIPFRARLAVCRLQLEKWAEAETVLREYLATAERTQPDHWATANAKSLLGSALLGRRQYADAEPQLLAGYKGLKAKENELSPPLQITISEAAERLVKLYEAWGKPEEAAKWQKVLMERKSKP